MADAYADARRAIRAASAVSPRLGGQAALRGVLRHRPADAGPGG